ncbi:GNAT family N-acetyltransferase [Roseibium sp.]|uniref:GNAT family N-acetyltransferase n=1 Tax=Roseibium sp. TaxID=1936156 RepID=UPI003BAFD410
MTWLGSEQKLPLQSDPASALIFRELEAPTLPELEDLYASLAAPVLTPFQTPQFLHALQETQCKPGEAALSVIRFSEAEGNGAPLMLLPLVRNRRGPLRVISLPDFGLADQNAPVISSAVQAPRVSLSDAVDAYFSMQEDADLVDVNKLHPHVGKMDNPLYSQAGCVPESKTLTIDLQAGAGETDWRRKSVYKKARSKFRKLAELGVDVSEASTPEERLALFSALAAQRKKRFYQLGRVDSLQRAERTAFYRCLAGLQMADTPYTGLALKQGGDIVAAMVLLRAGDQATGVLVSIGDEQWHGYSPGMVLFAKAIDWAIDNGLRWFAFGTGEQDYKQRFGGCPQETRRLLKPLSARGRLFLRARDAHHTAQELFQIALGRNKASA